MIQWSEQALVQLEEMHEYLYSRNPVAADHTVALVHTAAQNLATNPYMGRSVNDELREKVVVGTEFIIHYSIAGQEISIVGIYHSKQKRPH